MAGSGGYVGRERELDELSTRIADACAGTGGLALLTGEPGIGKTRLADELCARARAIGAMVAWGAALDEAGAPPYWPWTQILRCLTELSPELDVSPEVAPLLGGQTRWSDETEEARFLMHDAAARCLAATAARAPVVLVLDDLHLADRGTLDLAVHVSRSMRGRRLFVLGAYRDFEAGRDAEREELLARLARAGALVTLGPLSRGEVQGLVEDRLGSAPESDLMDTVMRSTGGNPLLIEGVLHLFGAGSPIAADSDADIRVPHGIRSVLRRRLELVSKARRSLEIAAVVGFEFDPTLVAAALGTSVAALDEQWALAIRSGLVVRGAGGRLAFAHDLVRQAVLEELGARAAEAEAHALVARALLEREGLGGAGTATELAHHLLASCDPDLATELARWARRAAAEASSMFAHHRAVDILRRALEQCGPERIGDRDHDELALELGQALVMAGQVSPARDVCARVLERARARSDSRLLVRAILLLAFRHELLVVNEDLFALLFEGLAAAGDGDLAARAQLQARLAAAMQPADDPHVCLAMAREAVAQIRTVGDTGALVHVLSCAGSAICCAPPAERIALEEELIRLAGQHAAPGVALRARARLFVAHLDQGDMAAADGCIEGYERLASVTASTDCLWMLPLMRAVLALAEGRLDDATRLVDEGAELSAGMWGLPQFSVASLRLGIDSAAGRREQVVADVEVMQQALGPMSSRPPIRAWVALANALVGVRFGDLEAARAVDIGATHDEALITNDEIRLANYSELAAALGWTDAARVCYEHMLGRDGTFVSFGVPALQLGLPYSYYLGRLAHAFGEEERARGHLEDALGSCVRAGARVHEVETRLVLADVIVSRDPARARELRRGALEMAESLGLPLLAERARAGLGGERAARPPDFELARAGDRWQLSCGGRTVTFKDMRGLRILERLLASPGQEIGALDLIGPGDGGEVAAGDAGPLLDREALAAYRARLRDIDGELSEAERYTDLGRAEKLVATRAALEAELRRAVGLGGRLRRAVSATERARVNVQRRLKDAIDKIRAFDPHLASHLDRSIRTGARCSYRP